MTCRELRMLLPMLSDLEEGKRRDMEEHARECRQCGEKMKQWKETCAQLSVWQEEEPPEEFHRGWRKALREESHAVKGAKRLRGWTAAAAAVVMLVCGTALFQDAPHEKVGLAQTENAVATDASMMRSTAYGESASTAVMMADAGTQRGASKIAQRESVILRSASLSLKSVRFDETLEKIEQLYARYGGWAQSSSVSGSALSENGQGRSAYMTLRIPEESLDAFLSELCALAQVEHREVSQQDVSDSYYDTQSRLDMYRAQHEKLLDLLESAQTLEDILAIDERASEIQYTIDSLEGEIGSWNSRAENAYVSLSVEEIAEETSEEAGLWQRVKAGVKTSWQNLGNFVRDMLVFMGAALPWVACLGAGAYLVSLPVRKWMEKRRKNG